AVAGGVRLAGIAERAHRTAAPGAHGAIFARAEARFVAAAATTPATAATATATLAPANDAEACTVGLAGIRERLAIASTLAADRIVLTRAEFRTGPRARAWRPVIALVDGHRTGSQHQHSGKADSDTARQP